VSRDSGARPFDEEADPDHALWQARRPRCSSTSVEDRLSWIGSMKNSMRITGEHHFAANDEDEWEVLRD